MRIYAKVDGENYDEEGEWNPPHCDPQEVVLDENHVQNVNGNRQVLEYLFQSESVAKLYRV